jgi:glucose/mannose-6-phosphate isomerase
MMHQLDDSSYVLRLDPKDMYKLTCAFPAQCAKALEIAKAADIPALDRKITSVVLTGLGGSAAGGDFTKALFEAYGSAPFIVNRDYHLASFVGPDTLVFATSYSGNTEETLSAYADAKKRGAKIVVVTNGGKLAEAAKADGVPAIIIPAGQPPRTALGYLLIPVVYACEKLGLIPAQDYATAFKLIENCVTEWAIEAAFENNPTKKLAQELYGNLSVLYGLGTWQAIVANRWKGQINENAKNMTFANAFPELNHNEILGWVLAGKQGVSKWVAVALEDGTESAKMKARLRVTEGLIKDVAAVHHVQAKGTALLEKMLSLTLFGDFVSLYLAALNGVDPENIDSINVLKAELGKVQ